MEIEVGEYVRVPTQGVFVISHININFDDSDYKKICICQNEKVAFTNMEEIKKCKHSKNIIDLIEDKEIVEIEYYVQTKAKRITRIFEVEKIGKQLVFLNHRCSFIYDLSEYKWLDGKGFNPKIKTILTKEQYNANCYRLEDTNG